MEDIENIITIGAPDMELVKKWFDAKVFKAIINSSAKPFPEEFAGYFEIPDYFSPDNLMRILKMDIAMDMYGVDIFIKNDQAIVVTQDEGDIYIHKAEIIDNKFLIFEKFVRSYIVSFVDENTINVHASKNVIVDNVTKAIYGEQEEAKVSINNVFVRKGDTKVPNVIAEYARRETMKQFK